MCPAQIELAGHRVCLRFARALRAGGYAFFFLGNALLALGRGMRLLHAAPLLDVTRRSAPRVRGRNGRRDLSRPRNPVWRGLLDVKYHPPFTLFAAESGNDRAGVLDLADPERPAAANLLLPTLQEGHDVRLGERVIRDKFRCERLPLRIGEIFGARLYLFER